MTDHEDLRDVIAGVSRRLAEIADAVETGDVDFLRSSSHIEEMTAEIAELAERVEQLDPAGVVELEQRLEAMQDSRDRVSATLRRLQRRKAVRVALAAAEGAGRVKERLTRLPGRTVVRPPHRSNRLVTQRVRSLRPAGGATSGPLVSVIIPTRDGAHHLERVLGGLAEATSYRSFEVIVVDNASTDGTPEVLAKDWGFPIRTIRNDQNESFSVSCNLGAGLATGDHLLFLNNDVEPINSGWLGAMVTDLEQTPSAAATGAFLVYPPARDERALTVQHRGIAFIWKDGGPRPVNLGDGEPADTPAFATTVEVAAATAACLLVRRSDFTAVGGFTEAYIYGWEDVDLCMKLRRSDGDILMTGDAALFHHEFGTQDLLGSDTRRINYLNNSRAFVERWAPQIRRLYLRDRINGDQMWARDGGRRIAITLTDHDQSAGYGDWYTAHELGDALATQGWDVTYLQRKDDDWYDTDADVVLMLLPQLDVHRLPEGTFTVAWVRNWVTRWLDNESFGDVDLVVASTAAFADEIERSTTHRVEVLPLATNPERFHAKPVDVALQCDYTFTGSFWGIGREIERFLDVRPDETFTIYGKGWDRRPRGQRYWRGHLEYDRLPDLYSSARLVIDDTVEPNLPAVNSRVFDALASGTLVIGDNATGSDEWFDGLLPTYTDRVELRALLDHYLANDDERTTLVSKLQALVLERHTYAHRAAQFTEAIEAAIERPEVAFRIGPVTWDVAEQWGDTHFARDVARALRRRGWRTRLAVVSEWDAPAAQSADVVIHLRGMTPYAVKPGSLNAMWLISHPDDVDTAELEKYDLVFVASAHHAAARSATTETPVIPLLQAADTHRYTPGDPDPELATRLVFVGNSRGEHRQMVDWAIERSLPLTVHGAGWDDLIPSEYIRSEHFPNDRLPDLYRSAEVILSDHWPDMARHGFISNRVFEAMAAGAVVVSDHVEGIEELGIEIARSAAELEAHVRGHLADPDARRAAGRRAADMVATDHSFDRRAEVMDTTFRRMLAARPGLDAPDDA